MARMRSHKSCIQMIALGLLLMNVNRAERQNKVICEKGDVTRMVPVDHDGPFNFEKGYFMPRNTNDSLIRCGLSVENPVRGISTDPFSQASCRGKCMKSPKEHSWLRAPGPYCRCTPKCYLYGTCCYDYPIECNKYQYQQDNPTNDDFLAALDPGLFSADWYTNYTFSANDFGNLRNLKHPDVSCRYVRYVKLKSVDFSPVESWVEEFFYVYISCSHDYPADEVRNKCENRQRGRSFNDILIDQLPVTSIRTGITYTNIFCAMCNFEQLSELSYFKAEIRHQRRNKSLGDKLNNITLDGLDSFVDSIEKNEVIFAFQPRDEQIENFLEPCLPMEIIQCDSSLRETISNYNILQVACKLYSSKTAFSTVNIPRTTTFKNAACALCNGYNESDLRPIRYIYGFQTIGRLPPSMALLIDFSHSGMTATRSKTGLKIEDVGTKCKKTEIYDLAVLRCRPIANMTNESMQCPVIKLDKDEFEINGSSLFLKQINEYLSANQFLILNSTAFVCANYSYQFGKLLAFFDYSYQQKILSQVGSAISLIALGATFVTYAIFPSLQTLPGRCLMNLTVAIFIAQLVMVTIMNETSIPSVCIGIAVVEHYFWLSAVFWSNVLTFDIFFTFRHKFQIVMTSVRTKRFYVYLLWAWGLPAVGVGICFVVDYYQLWGLTIGYGGSRACWISNQNALIFTFALPLGVILFGNVMFYINTVLKIAEIGHLAQTVKLRGYRKSNNWQYLKMTSVVGFTWIIGFVAAFTQITSFWYVFIVLNSLQGTFIFLSFVCTRRVLVLYKSLLGLTDGTDQTSSFRVVFSRKSLSKATTKTTRDESDAGSVQTAGKTSPPLTRRDTPPCPLEDEVLRMVDGMPVVLNEVELNKNP